MLLTLRAAALAPARTVNWMGRPFRVVPAVLVRSQVLHNNLGRTFLPADEITEEWADSWNGIPVLIGPHPAVRGVAASGRNPEILNARGAGWIFAARANHAQDGARRLTGEVWLDTSRVDAVPGLSAVLAAVDAGQPVELSTGFATTPEQRTGNFQGQQYDWILHPQGADHLVISTEMTGACSVSDGCGLGVNCQCGGTCMSTKAQDAPVTPGAAVTDGATNDTPTQSVDGTPHPRGDFAYAPAGSNPSEWKLPIFDAAHVRAALARFNQAQIPANARGAVWRRILAAADRYNVTVSDRTMPSMNVDERAGFKGMVDRITALFTAAPKAPMTYEEMAAVAAVREMAFLSLMPSDQERAQMLKEALQEKYGDLGREVVVCDVYTEPEKYVVFWFTTPMGPQPEGQLYYQATWADADNDGIPEITQAGDPVLVRRMTSYEPVGSGPAGDGAPAGNTASDKAVDTKAGEPALQASTEDTPMDEQEKKAINDLTAAVKALGEQVAATNNKVTALETSDVSIAGLKRHISALTEKVDNVIALTAPAVEERERERVNLVQKLSGNHRVPFTLAELEAKPLDELRKIEQLANTTGAGRPGPQGGASAAEDKRYMEPVPYHVKQDEGTRK